MNFKPYSIIVQQKHIDFLMDNKIFLSLKSIYKNSWFDKLKGKNFIVKNEATVEPFSAFLSNGFVSMGAHSYTKSSFDKDILVGPAQYYSRNQRIDNNAIYVYKKALKYDPYSVQFLGIYGQLEFFYRNKNNALMVKHTLEKIAPNSNAYKRINDLTKGLK